MPYAYIHYPFENVELFENNFPGHFVAEGLDQTRGWYVYSDYVLYQFDHEFSECGPQPELSPSSYFL